MLRLVTIGEAVQIYGVPQTAVPELGAPDRINGCALYLEARVEAFAAAWEHITFIRASREKDECDRKRDKRRGNWLSMYYETLYWSATVPVEFSPPASIGNAYRWAEVHYRKMDAEEGIEYRGTNLKRFAAWMRHHHTNYDRLVDELVGRTGSLDARNLLRERATCAVLVWIEEQRTETR